MANIVVNSAKMQEAASKISAKVQLLEDDINKIDTICTEIEDAWTGEGSQAYIESVRDKKVKLTGVIEGLEKLPDTFNQIAQSMKEIESQIASISRNE